MARYGLTSKVKSMLRAEAANVVRIGYDAGQQFDDAFNDFCEHAAVYMSPSQERAWEEFNLKATCTEIVEEALRVLNISEPR